MFQTEKTSDENKRYKYPKKTAFAAFLLTLLAEALIIKQFLNRLMSCEPVSVDPAHHKELTENGLRNELNLPDRPHYK